MAPRVPFRRIAAAAAAVALPAIAVLLLLVLFGWAEPVPAALGALVAIVGAGLLVRPHLRHLKAIADYVSSIAAEGPARPAADPQTQPLPLAMVPELSTAAVGAVAAWTRRQKELEAVVAAGEAILRALPDPLILLDRDARIVKANPAAESLFETPLAGRSLFTVLRDPVVIGAVDDVLQGRPGTVVEMFLPVPVERTFSARVEALTAPTADGTAALLTLHDLTRIRRADRMRADFVANASHELRTPISTLIGFIETLQGPARDDAEARERFLSIMHDQASRMARVVADLLSLSRIELNEHTPPSGQVALGALLRQVVDALELRAAGRNMRILLGVEPPGAALALVPQANGEAALATLPPVAGDADELAQVFQNLIDNAIKYGRAGSEIGIAAWLARPPGSRRIAGPAVAVAVIDRGEGIAREHLPRLTERFYRIDTARSRDLGGTGLGLAIVKHILNRHRGDLEIASIPGTGSAFTAFLPVAGTASSAAADT